MLKYIKVIAAVLSLMLLFTGCVQESYNFGFLNSQQEAAYYTDLSSVYEQTVKMDVLKEDKSLIEEKEEYMQLFKRFCGFSLPNNFVLPENPEEIGWKINISERYIDVNAIIFVEKDHALEMLEHLRNDNSWTAFSSIAGAYIRTPELRELCNTFEKSYKYDETINNFNMVVLDFLYDEESNYYVMYMIVGLERDPPPGTSWPDISWTIH